MSVLLEHSWEASGRDMAVDGVSSEANPLGQSKLLSLAGPHWDLRWGAASTRGDPQG